MKKLLAIFLIICMLFSLVACAKADDTDSSASKDETSASTPTGGEESKPTVPDTPSEPDTPSTPSKDDSSSKVEYVSPQDSVDPATCVHAFLKANCTEPKRCAKCRTTVGKAEGHDFETPACDKPQVCTKCGEKGIILGHYYKDADCLEPKHCLNCNKKVGSALGHKMSGGQCTRCDAFSQDYAPTLYFTGNMDKMKDKKDVRDITFKYRNRDGIVEGAATIKLQGSSSLAYDKKNFTIKFADAVDVGWGEQKEYCLKANWVDKTHCRNVVTAKLVGEMQEKYGLLTGAPNNGAIDGFPIQVYINGEFHGVYTMNIPKAAWQFGMDEDNPNHIVIGGDEWGDDTYFKSVPQGWNFWEVEVGEENDDTLYKLQRLVSFVKDSSDADFKKNIGSYLNLDATINYYIMMRFAFMRDNYGKNMLLATYDGKVWYPSLYDLDTCWGTRWDGLSLEQDYLKGWTLGTGGSLLFERLEKNFKKEIAERYFDLRKDVLNPNHIMDMFESFYARIPKDALAQEQAKWDTPEHPIPGYDLSQIKEYLDKMVPIYDSDFHEWL